MVLMIEDRRRVDAMMFRRRDLIVEDVAGVAVTLAFGCGGRRRVPDLDGHLGSVKMAMTIADLVDKADGPGEILDGAEDEGTVVPERQAAVAGSADQDRRERIPVAIGVV